MTLQSSSIPELVQIAVAGGSMRLRAAHLAVLEMVQIAAAAKKGGAHVTFVGANRLGVTERVQIATAAPGAVTFDDE